MGALLSQTEWKLFIGFSICYSCFHLEPARAESIPLSSALQYLYGVHDQYHTSYPVYEDLGSAGNRGHALQEFPNGNSPMDLIHGATDSPFEGATHMRFIFTPQPGQSGGFIRNSGVLHNGAFAPVADFGFTPDVGYDLTGATRLTFQARRISGNGIITAFVGGVGHNNGSPFPDSLEEVRQNFTLTDDWAEYALDIPAGRDLSRVRNLLGIGQGYNENPTGSVVDVDNVRFELSPTGQAQRLMEPRFLQSYETRSLQPNIHDANTLDDIDLTLRNAAVIYDSAVASLAFMAHGSAKALEHSRFVSEAFLYAQNHDRTTVDGRLSSFYGAGDISLPHGWLPNGRAGTVPVAGFYDPTSNVFHELGESNQYDVGNNSWAMISLLHQYRETGDVRYLDGARKLGEFVQGMKYENGAYPGFFGRLQPGAMLPGQLAWASTEHAIDVSVAFRLMYALTGETQWAVDAQHALDFVESMYDPVLGLYRPGTTDPDNINTDFLPADVNNWAIIGNPETLNLHPDLLDRVLETFQTIDNEGRPGIDFNEDLDGVQFEMTAHLILALRAAGRDAEADLFLATLLDEQEADGSLTAALRGDGLDGLTTGIDFKYFDRAHVGATAWLTLALLDANPYYLDMPVPSLTAAPVPEPSSLAGAATALVGFLVLIGRRQRMKRAKGLAVS